MATISHQPVFFDKQKTIPAEAQEGDYQKINNGAVKQVCKKIISNPEGTGLMLDPERVLYVSDSYLDRREILGEVQKANDIRVSLKKASPDLEESYIQTDLEVLDEASGARGVSAPAAIGNLDDFIRNKDISLQTRLDIAFQIIKGMHNMQKAGYVTGDAKLENILVFEKDGHIIVRISDFGKARRLEEGSVSMVDGNPRFTGPENILTRESEVFSTGLMLLRAIEEGIDPDLCSKLTVKDIRGGVAHDRRGIEGELLREGRKARKGVTGQLGFAGSYALGKTSYVSKQASHEQDIIHKHIDRLSSDYFFAPHLDDASGLALLQTFELIKDMTQASPEKRPSMKEAEKRFAKVMDTMQTSLPEYAAPKIVVVQDTSSETSALEEAHEPISEIIAAQETLSINTSPSVRTTFEELSSTIIVPESPSTDIAPSGATAFEEAAVPETPSAAPSETTAFEDVSSAKGSSAS